MATSILLDQLAADALKTLRSRLEAVEGRDDSGRKIVNALVFCATPEQTLGMLNAFARAKAAQRGEDEQAEASD